MFHKSVRYIMFLKLVKTLGYKPVTKAYYFSYKSENEYDRPFDI